MKIEDAEYVLQRINQEGFHYCFTHYSNFSEIEDNEFHRLRLASLAASRVLETYIKDQSINGEGDE